MNAEYKTARVDLNKSKSIHKKNNIDLSNSIKSSKSNTSAKNSKQLSKSNSVMRNCKDCNKSPALCKCK